MPSCTNPVSVEALTNTVNPGLFRCGRESLLCILCLMWQKNPSSLGKYNLNSPLSVHSDYARFLSAISRTMRAASSQCSGWYFSQKVDHRTNVFRKAVALGQESPV